MEAQARAGPGEAGRPLRRLADCKVTCRGIRWNLPGRRPSVNGWWSTARKRA